MERSDEVEQELLPVRMVNAHTFCNRLFWLEHVEGLFAPNEHTVEGNHVHRRVDKPGGKLPPPDSEENPEATPWHARSLWLSCTTLGVSGKLDLVDERDGGVVMPVDTKKGRSDEGALWPADRVQLTLQALLLRAAGYQVAEVSAWYAAERRRVSVPLTDALVDEARAAVAATQRTQAAPQAPEPLVDSPKCYGCSLNQICLPDEVRCLQNQSTVTAEEEAFVEAVEGVRRVVPPRFDAVPLYVKVQGATLRSRQDEVQVVDREGKVLQSAGLQTISHINLYGQVHITGPLMRDCIDRDIPVCFFSSGGWYRGRTAASGNRSVHVRIAQFRAFQTTVGHGASKRWIADKIHNGRTLLRRNRADDDGIDEVAVDELRRVERQALDADTAASLLGHEGNAARMQWAAFSHLLARTDEAFRMQGRTRRPPRDRANAMLSYVYGMLTKDCALAAEMVGLDPYLGMYHTPHHGRPSMALDLMEPFRPLVADSVVLGVVRRREVQPDDFILAGQQVTLKPHARKTLALAYERRMDEMVQHPVFGYAITYRAVLYVQARLLTRYFLGEVPQPPSFRTR